MKGVSINATKASFQPLMPLWASYCKHQKRIICITISFNPFLNKISWRFLFIPRIISHYTFTQFLSTYNFTLATQKRKPTPMHPPPSPCGLINAKQTVLLWWWWLHRSNSTLSKLAHPVFSLFLLYFFRPTNPSLHHSAITALASPLSDRPSGTRIAARCVPPNTWGRMQTGPYLLFNTHDDGKNAHTNVFFY